MPSATPVAVITGSGRRRVGHVIANHLAICGYRLALHYHGSADEARETVQLWQGRGVDVEAFPADVGREADVDRMFEQVMQRFGRLDALVTTASVWEPTPLESITAEQFLESYQVNTLGTFLCARRAGLLMAEQSEGGSIVTFGDWAIERPYPGYAAYFAAKGAIPTLTRTLAVELAQRNPRVRVNCIHPGPVMFPPGASEQEQQARIQATLVKQANCPETVAHAVQFLLENSFVTGVCLPVDGGRSVFAAELESRGRPKQKPAVN